MYSEIKRTSFHLESGDVLKEITIGYHTFGKLNASKSNVVWVCHGLTANSNVLDWWNGLFGQNSLFKPDQYFIVCANTIGSCYGSTGPTTCIGESIALLDEFPLLTTRDQARAYEELRKELGLERVYALVGASLGGQQALEWSIEQPNRFDNLVLIATNAQHSAYGIAFNESQRMAIEGDPTYGAGQIDGGKDGLAIARSIAMLSYRSYSGYAKTQTESANDKTDHFRASSYQVYQGSKLAERFDAYAYVTLSKSMDSHNVGRHRASIPTVLHSIKSKTLVIGISSDVLFPLQEQRFLAAHIPNADFVEIHSSFGHDGFLVETEKLSKTISEFLAENYSNIRPTVFKTTIKKNQLINLATSV